jgi:hypothetical protein
VKETPFNCYVVVTDVTASTTQKVTCTDCSNAADSGVLYFKFFIFKVKEGVDSFNIIVLENISLI